MAKDKKNNNVSQDEDAMDTSIAIAGENGSHDTENSGPSYEDKFKYMNAMASPIAPKKLAKKLFKCVKQAAKQKNYIRLGLRETQKYIRRGERGLVVFAGNVSPIDIYSHMPVVCEEANIPYVFVPSKEDLGSIIRANRTCCLLMIRPHPEYKELYDEIIEKINKLEPFRGQTD
ncbi:unnamed protein product [Rotaria socialis]|uniref:Ribosomal protein eL8/eL30/eS12/Gadd45 domain-containing protein n=1 Tax=Rotaria socialis TaxID=392032 RepID=A0A818J6Z7_9BILA|nr:unnamed protein product [Rotaria socialis]CAF3328344.1 unnamed protein product [Rotaria socialis]CAF3351497.1 unnamed protein product [Rotaria socialis]CAF3536700.1 unnamed protein product [Rotaria socialis]CAF3646159.1 unnamed protein product [Rotaria socialis]